MRSLIGDVLYLMNPAVAGQVGDGLPEVVAQALAYSQGIGATG